MKKIAIITGASSGMGREFALQLSADVLLDEIWLLARRKKRLIEVEKIINQNHSQNSALPIARSFEIDLSGRNGISSYRALLEVQKEITQKEGGFEIAFLVNNAGFGTYGPFVETPLEEELNMIDLNCTALTGIAGISLDFMNKGAVMINTASLASYLPLGNFAVYGATKAYVLSFSTALAAEVYDKGITVLSLCPGPVSTEFANVASNGARKEVLNGQSAEETVRHCLKKARSKKHFALMTFKWKFAAFASRFVPKYFGARYTFLHCPRPRKN